MRARACSFLICRIYRMGHRKMLLDNALNNAKLTPMSMSMTMSTSPENDEHEHQHQQQQTAENNPQRRPSITQLVQKYSFDVITCLLLSFLFYIVCVVCCFQLYILCFFFKCLFLVFWLWLGIVCFMWGFVAGILVQVVWWDRRRGLWIVLRRLSNAGRKRSRRNRKSRQLDALRARVLILIIWSRSL